MNQLDAKFGEYGGMYVPELLIPALDQLEQAFLEAKDDPAFNAEFMSLLKDYAGRPTSMTLTRNLVSNPKVKLYLKREDLLHGGAHKTNQVLGQALLTKRMGKTEVIAETGAGQHGVATALACALLGLKARIYMGAKDVERQAPNVYCQVGKETGGTGQQFDWSLIHNELELDKLIIAGGISPANVADAQATGADMVDVNSGVETKPGDKSDEQVTALFSVCRRY